MMSSELGMAILFIFFGLKKQMYEIIRKFTRPKL